MLTWEQEDFLAHGFTRLMSRSSPFAHEDDARAAWRIHGPRIMDEWDVSFRRPWGWWMERGEEPGGNDVVRLLELDALTPQELSRLPDHLTPSLARTLAASPALARYPALKEAVFSYPSLLVGLTRKGVDAFLDTLPHGRPRVLADSPG